METLSGPIARSAALLRVDVGSVDLLVTRLRAGMGRLRDAVGAARGAVPSDWAGRGRREADAAVVVLDRRIGALTAAFDAIAVALSAVAEAVRSMQAEAGAARRVLAAEGALDVSGVVARQLEAGLLRLDAADRQAAQVVRDALLGGPLWQRASASFPSLPGASLAGRARAIVADVEASTAAPEAPAAVALWWAGLSTSARSAVTSTWTWIAGSLDGLPGRVRDQLNRRRLAVAIEQATDDYAQARGGGSGFGHGLTIAASEALPWPLSLPLTVLDTGRAIRVRKAADRLNALQRIRAALTRPGSELLTFSTAGDGLAVVATADPESSRSVAVLVPGMNTEIEDVPRLVDEGERLAAAAGAGTAVIAWLGYDAPGVLHVVSDGAAKSGASRLQRFTAGLRATASGRQQVTVIGHSYGTLVGGIAAKRGLDTDDVVFLASPGVEASSAGELHLAPGHVWAARSPTDPIEAVFLPAKAGKLIGVPVPTWYGPDPASPGFGAHHFGVGGAFGHSGYFSAGSQSLANLGRIVSGRPMPP